MFRRSSFGIGLTAWLLSLALLSAWAACLGVCLLERPGEAAENRSEAVAESKSTAGYIEMTDDPCNCPEMAKPAFTIQERETISPPALVSASIPFVPAQSRASMPRSNLPGDAALQFPPGGSSAPLFLRHRTLRI